MSELRHYESILIGACLQAPELIAEAGLTAKDFACPDLGEAWQAMQTLMARNEAPDAISVSDATSVPFATLIECQRDCYSTAPELVLSWASIIRNKARRDRLAAGLHALATSEHDADMLLHYARELLLGIEGDTPTKARTNAQILDDRLAALDARVSGAESPIGLTWGVKDFDALSYGLKPSELVVLAARPGMGKTALALQVARLNATKGKRVAVFSMEMDEGELFDRMICQGARFPADHYADPAKASVDLSILGPTVVELRDADLHCFDNVFDIETLTAKSRALHQQKPLDLIVVDYLQLIGTKGQRNQNRAIEVGEYSRALKMLAMQLGCPVLLLSQLNRNVETRPDRRPLMADLRESGSVEQDANKVVMIYRDEVYNEASPDKGVAELILRKHRGGSTGTARSAGNLRCFRFDDLAYSHQQQEAPRHDPFA